MQRKTRTAEGRSVASFFCIQFSIVNSRGPNKASDSLIQSAKVDDEDGDGVWLGRNVCTIKISSANKQSRTRAVESGSSLFSRREPLGVILNCCREHWVL